VGVDLADADAATDAANGGPRVEALETTTDVRWASCDGRADELSGVC
jgi:hypothetical protein